MMGMVAVIVIEQKLRPTNMVTTFDAKYDMRVPRINIALQV